MKKEEYREIAEKMIEHYEAAVQLMDDELREEIHAELAPCSDIDFLTEYIKRHYEKYGEVFSV